MPFTFAHPAAIIPFWKKWSAYFNLPALIIGSMVPDLGFFLPMKIPRHVSHSLWGILEFNLPFGLLICMVFYKFLYNPSLFLCPNAILQRLPLHRGLPKILPIVPSVLLGASTHVFWDSLTHRGTWFTKTFHAMNDIAFHIGNMDVPYYRVLQHSSTLLGTLIIYLSIRRWKRTHNLINQYESYMGTPVFIRLIILGIITPMIIVGLKWNTFSFETMMDWRYLISKLGLQYLEINLAIFVVYAAYWNFYIRFKSYK